MVATVTRPTIQATWTAMVFPRLVISVGRHGFPAFRGTIIGLWLGSQFECGVCASPVESRRRILSNTRCFPIEMEKSGSLILWIRGLTDLINHGSIPLLIKIVQGPTDYECTLWWWRGIWTSWGIDDADIYCRNINFQGYSQRKHVAC